MGILQESITFSSEIVKIYCYIYFYLWLNFLRSIIFEKYHIFKSPFYFIWLSGFIAPLQRVTTHLPGSISSLVSLQWGEENPNLRAVYHRARDELSSDREQKCKQRWIKSAAGSRGSGEHVDALWLHNDSTDCVSAQISLSLRTQITQTTSRSQSHARRTEE